MLTAVTANGDVAFPWPCTRILEWLRIAMINSADIRAVLVAVVGIWQPVWELLSGVRESDSLFKP